jgi:ketosteroid isomerase-like protein
MSEENLEIVRRIWDADASRDAATILALYDPQVEWDMSQFPLGTLSRRAVYHGHEGLRDWFREWTEAWENIQQSPHELIDAGDHVVSVSTTRGRGRASGAEVVWERIAAVWTVRDGKVARVVWFQTRGEAFEAAGLRA